MRQRLHTNWARERNAGLQLHIKVTANDKGGYTATHDKWSAEGDDEAQASRRLKEQLEKELYRGANEHSAF